MQVIDEVREDFTHLIKADLGSTPSANQCLHGPLVSWLHLKARQVPQRPRQVHTSPEVEAKKRQFPAITQVISSLERGDDMTPYLGSSVRGSKATESTADQLFNDWKINHFHLGRFFEKPDKVDRTQHLLFVLVRADHAIALAGC
ncbi:hypothetical protein [Rhodovibrio salinarum]|uniref:Uncharacterized protein n=1 Tax=Rhodovibrio salinarum TaxID=1087 RepID=A0A934QFQ9_9PROT|nr:hypothetical protein [Rhodovibrio salinarum]MBK1695655.1 hypothetical protein [Rhodovibrio salinarum]